MSQTYYKLDMTPDVFAAAVSGKTSNTIRTRHRDVACDTGTFVLAEVTPPDETGRYLKVDMKPDDVRHKRFDEITEEEMIANGVPKDEQALNQFLQKVIMSIADRDGENVANDKVDWAQNQMLTAGKTPMQVAFLLDMQTHYPDLDWHSSVTIVPHANPVEISKNEVDQIIEANKQVRGEQRQVG